MRLTIDVALAYTVSAADPALLMIEAASCPGQRVLHTRLAAEGATLRRSEGAGKVWAHPVGTALAVSYIAMVEVTRAAPTLATLNATPPADLPLDVLPFLRPSRFCQSDLFTDFALQQFGALEGGAKAAAIRDWVAAEVSYVPGSSHGATTATDTFSARAGVCRDFTHLLCALVRAAHIPARYASVYGAEVSPDDFHAIAQVWLDGGWVPVDATQMGPPHEMAVIATGRDAADVAFMETALWADVVAQSVRVTKA